MEYPLMSIQLTHAPRPLPTGLIRVGSLALFLHFLAVGVLVLSAASGPWPTRFGESLALGPTFAGKMNNFFTPYYLEPLRLTHNYHFSGNRVLVSAVYFEVRLKK